MATEVDDLEKRNRELKDEIEKLTNGSDPVESLETKKKTFATDIEKFKLLVAHRSQHFQEVKDAIKKAEMELEAQGEIVLINR